MCSGRRTLGMVHGLRTQCMHKYFHLFSECIAAFQCHLRAVSCQFSPLPTSALANTQSFHFYFQRYNIFPPSSLNHYCKLLNFITQRSESSFLHHSSRSYFFRSSSPTSTKSFGFHYPQNATPSIITTHKYDILPSSPSSSIPSLPFSLPSSTPTPHLHHH